MPAGLVISMAGLLTNPNRKREREIDQQSRRKENLTREEMKT